MRGASIGIYALMWEGLPLLVDKKSFTIFAYLVMRPKKKDVCLPFSDWHKILKTLVAFFFFFFFFLIFSFAFLNKIVKNIFSKCIVTVPKVHCVSTEGICVYPYMSPPDFDATYSNTENYMNYIAYLQHPDLKKKKSTYWPSQFPVQKSKQTFICLGLIKV